MREPSVTQRIIEAIRAGDALDDVAARLGLPADVVASLMQAPLALALASHQGADE